MTSRGHRSSHQWSYVNAEESRNETRHAKQDRQLTAYLAAINSGSPDEVARFVSAHYATLRHDDAPASAYAWWHQVAQRTTEGLLVVHLEEDQATTLRVHAEPRTPRCPLPAGCTVSLSVQEAPPHALTDLPIRPLLPPASYVTLDGRRMAYTLQGSGRPLIVLEAGWGWGRWAWDWILPGLTAVTEVLAYDRAGVGESEAVAPEPRSTQQMADDLARLLAALDLQGPYLLVGHSLGGLIARVFTRAHRDAVAGLVLIDAFHEDGWGPAEAALLPHPADDEPPSVAQWRDWLEHGMYDWARLPEYLDAAASIAQGRACGGVGDRPLTVMRAGQYVAPPEFPRSLATAIEELRCQVHESQTRLSTQSRYIVAEKSGHIVQYDEPELVLSSILDVVR